MSDTPDDTLLSVGKLAKIKRRWVCIASVAALFNVSRFQTTLRQVLGKELMYDVSKTCHQ